MCASAIELFAALGGLMTTSIVIGGFLAHVRPALARRDEVELRRATVIGGLWGLAFALLGVLVIRVVV